MFNKDYLKVTINVKADDTTGIDFKIKKGLPENDILISLFNGFAAFTNAISSYYSDHDVAEKILREAFEAGLKMDNKKIIENDEKTV